MADEKSIINAPVLESELDTILGAKGIIVKSENIKAIGVPAHNLVPDENGVVALEKQDAFLKPETSQLSSPTVQETPLVAATSINPEMPVSDTIPAEQPIAQVDSAPVSQQTEPTINNPTSNIDTNLTNGINTSELESKEVLNNDLQVPAMEAAAEIMNAQTDSNGEIEEVLYNKPGDILTGPAVDVSNQNVLGSIDFSSLKREEKPVEEEKKEDTYETITPVELPTMPSEIPAQEPVGEVSASLFANAEPQSDTPSMQEQLEPTSSIPMLQETDVPTNIPSVEPPKENNSIENFESLGNPLTQSNIDVADSPFIPPQINNPIDNMELNSQSNNLGLPEVNVPVADDQNKVMKNSSVFENLSEESELQEDKVPMLEESNQNPTLDLPSFATDSNNVDNNDIVSDLTDVNNDVKIDEIINKIDDIKDLVLSLKVSNVTKKNESDEIINSLPTLEMPLSSTTDPLPTMTDSVVPETLNQIDNSKVENLDDNMIMGGKFL